MFTREKPHPTRSTRPSPAMMSNKSPGPQPPGLAFAFLGPPCWGSSYSFGVVVGWWLGRIVGFPPSQFLVFWWFFWEMIIRYWVWWWAYVGLMVANASFDKDFLTVADHCIVWANDHILAIWMYSYLLTVDDHLRINDNKLDVGTCRPSPIKVMPLIKKDPVCGSFWDHILQ